MSFTQLKQTEVAFNTLHFSSADTSPQISLQQQADSQGALLSHSSSCQHCTRWGQRYISHLQFTVGNPGFAFYSTLLPSRTGYNIFAEGSPFAQSSHKYIIKAPVTRKLLFWWCINVIHHQDVIWAWWISGKCHQSSIVEGIHHFPAGPGKSKSTTNNTSKDFV